MSLAWRPSDFFRFGGSVLEQFTNVQKLTILAKYQTFLSNPSVYPKDLTRLTSVNVRSVRLITPFMDLLLNRGADIREFEAFGDSKTFEAVSVFCFLFFVFSLSFCVSRLSLSLRSKPKKSRVVRFLETSCCRKIASAFLVSSLLHFTRQEESYACCPPNFLCLRCFFPTPALNKILPRLKNMEFLHMHLSNQSQSKFNPTILTKLHSLQDILIEVGKFDWSKLAPETSLPPSVKTVCFIHNSRDIALASKIDTFLRETSLEKISFHGNPSAAENFAHCLDWKRINSKKSLRECVINRGVFVPKMIGCAKKLSVSCWTNLDQAGFLLFVF